MVKVVCTEFALEDLKSIHDYISKDSKEYASRFVRVYLNKNEVLEIEKELATSNSDYFIGAMYLAAGLFVYFRKRFRHAKTTASKKFMPADGDL